MTASNIKLTLPTEMLTLLEHLEIVERDANERANLFTALREAINALPAAEAEGNDAVKRAIANLDGIYVKLKALFDVGPAVLLRNRLDSIGWCSAAYSARLLEEQRNIRLRYEQSIRDAQKAEIVEIAERKEFERYETLKRKYGSARNDTATHDMRF